MRYGAMWCEKHGVCRHAQVMPYSTQCNTPLSNFEAGLDYRDVSDPAVMVSFPIVARAAPQSGGVRGSSGGLGGRGAGGVREGCGRGAGGVREGCGKGAGCRTGQV